MSRAPTSAADPKRPATVDLTDGTEQEERPQPALAPGYFEVDERSLGELLHTVSRVAANLRYVASDNQPKGTWAGLYLNDVACVLAEMVSLDTDRLRATFLRLGAAGDVRRQAVQLRALAARMDRWLGALKRSEQAPAVAFATTLAGMVDDELAASLHVAGALLAGDGASASDAAAYAKFDRAWGLVLDPDGGVAFPRGALPSAPSARRERLASAWGTLLNAVSYLSTPARATLDEVLRSGRNDPATGLVLAFLTLFMRSREGLNRFPQRRLDFYYRTLLGMAPRERTPDQAHLVLRPAPGVTSFRVPAGTEFWAGRDERKDDLVFTSDEPVVITDAEVMALKSLHYERDRLISPEREFGFVTRILGGSATEPAPEAGDGEPVPVFPPTGAGSPFSAEGVSLGFAVASPILALAEGTRTLVFDIELGDPVVEAGTTLDEAIAALDDLPEGRDRDFFERFGRLFTRGLLAFSGRAGGGASWCTDAQKDLIRRAARRVLGDAGASSAAIVEDVLTRDPLVLFHELFRAALVVRFTGQDGWERASDVYVGPRNEADGPAGLRIEMTLGPDAGPLVPFSAPLHGTGYRGGLPVVSFRVNPQSIFYPFSLLDCLALRRIGVEVDVRGVTDLVVQNGLGALDPTKPFQPFGPVPSRDSYLVVGSWEAARKKLVSASLDLEWAELPDAPGGFRQHYFLYGRDVTNESFRAEVAVLRDGRWEPADPEHRVVAPLFRTEGDGGRVARHASIPLEPIEMAKPVGRNTDRAAFASMVKARQGLFRVSLAGSRATFGHQEYARLLTEVLSRNARKRKPEPLPEPPYTPLLSRLRLNYQARTTLYPGGAAAAASDDAVEQILHEHPFGIEDLTAASDEHVYSLMPGRPRARGDSGLEAREGYLFIGLTGSDLSGALSLLFHIRHDAVQDPLVSDPEIAWFVLSGNRWRELEGSRVLGDTTEGFQRSGIVTLDLPRDVERGSTILPGDLYWLAVGANRHMLSLAARLLSVSAGAVRVTWHDRGNLRPAIGEGLPAGTIRRALSGVAGLGSVTQVGESFGGRPAEDPDGLVTRTAERLRHKNRAVSTWDYERLVLDRFPTVHQVKVFPNTDTRYDRPMPGRVLVVVVPRLMRREDDRTLTPRFSGDELIRIRDELTALSSGMAQVHVRNPVYEQVQIRCTVKLARGTRSGYCLQELNEALVDYISPWRPGGYGARFGWRIRRKDIEARIRELPYVEFVTNFSMLQITLDPDGRHSLDDTARPATVALTSDQMSALPSSALHELSARYPWSLAVPTRRHFIETTPGDFEIPPEVTGVGELEIGSNFILDAGRRHG